MPAFSKNEIEILIQQQQSAVRQYAGFAIAIFCFGLILLLLSKFFSDENIIQNFVKAGGIFISTLSSFPIKEVINRRDRIGMLNIIKNFPERTASNPDDISFEEQTKANEIIWKLVEKTTLGI